MKKNRDVLKIILAALILIFLMLCAAALLLADHRKSVEREARKQKALQALENIPTVTPTPAVTATPTPAPTATPTPTPVITRAPAFQPDEYWNVWYSTDGLATVNIYQISLETVSFTFAQASDSAGTHVAEADVTAEVAGNAAILSFSDSWGNQVSGNMTFDQGRLYVRLETTAAAAGAGVTPHVNCIMTRTKTEPPALTPTETPAPEENTGEGYEENGGNAENGEYFFPESGTRYLTDEEVSGYSSSELELAKNEIYARHGRIFVTQRISDYFNSRSWYQGTIDAETFDAQQDSIFNEYESANIELIARWEAQKRSQGE